MDKQHRVHGSGSWLWGEYDLERTPRDFIPQQWLVHVPLRHVPGKPVPPLAKSLGLGVVRVVGVPNGHAKVHSLRKGGLRV
jgi:hypothetical protein